MVLGGLAAEPLRSAPKNPLIKAMVSQNVDSSGLDYLCVLDFEATCNNKKPAPRPQEIIEFPTLLLNVSTGEVEREFHHYIKPDVHPTLSAFCTELTGITQATVDDGISLDRAIILHQEWIREIGVVPSHSTDASSAPTFAYITCGDWDLKTCLPSQLRYHSMEVPSIFESWINVKHEFQGLYGKKAGGMNGMLRTLGMDLEGRHHSGIDDCRNIARICQRMLEDGWVPGGAAKRAQRRRAQEAAEAAGRATIRAEREETKRKKRESRARKIAQMTEEGF